jgi:hypothetical protein
MSLGILCPPVSLGAVIKYQGEGDIRWPMVGVIFLTYLMMNHFGAKAGKKVDSETFGQVGSITHVGLSFLPLTLYFFLRSLPPGRFNHACFFSFLLFCFAPLCQSILTCIC